MNEIQGGSCYVLTTHPQIIGRAHTIQMLEKLIQYMESRGAWFATLGESMTLTRMIKGVFH